MYMNFKPIGCSYTYPCFDSQNVKSTKMYGNVDAEFSTFVGGTFKWNIDPNNWGYNSDFNYSR